MRYQTLKTLMLSFFSASPMGACVHERSDLQKCEDFTWEDKITALEISFQGRIGISATHTVTQERRQHRAEESFDLFSTSKVIPVAAILQQSMANPSLLDKKLTFTQELIGASGYAPILEKRSEYRMSIAELCAASLQYSDNAAYNLLISELGGPEAVIAFARSLGDTSFNFYHVDPELKSDIYPANLRFTSTPSAMESSLHKLALGDALAAPQRELFVAWLKGSKTGDARIRAGVPKGWVVADKTGTGTEHGITNDIGIVWLPDGALVVLTVFFTHTDKDAKVRDEVVATLTRLIFENAKSLPSSKNCLL